MRSRSDNNEGGVCFFYSGYERGQLWCFIFFLHVDLKEEREREEEYFEKLKSISQFAVSK